MATEQPVAGDKLNSSDHSLMHRQIAADSSAPVKSIDIDADGAIQGGTPLFQNINPTNLISNGDFESWSAGTAVAPDGWTAQGAGASVAREGTIFKLGTYSSAFTRGGTNCSFYQDVASTRGITYFRGRNITFGMWVYATVAARTKLIVIDNGGSSASSFHTGGSSWEFLTVTHTVDAAATGTLIARADIEAGDTTCYYDGAMLVEGSSAFAFSPKPITNTASIIKAWVNFSGADGSLNEGFNITSTSRSGTGRYTVTWDTDFANTTYVCVGNTEDDSASRTITFDDIATGSINVKVDNDGGSAVDPDLVMIMAIGTQ